jgi:hypothetical protein
MTLRLDFEWQEKPAEGNIPLGYQLFVNGKCVADVVSSDYVDRGFVKEVRWVWAARHTPTPSLPLKMLPKNSLENPVSDPETAKSKCEAYVRSELEADFALLDRS